MRRAAAPYRLSFIFVALVAACESPQPLPDAATDAATDGSRVPDMGRETDASADASPDTACEGDCATTALTALFGGTTESFDAAYFGLNDDGSLHLEAYGGAAEGCPSETSPTPARTLVFGSLALPPRGESAPAQVSLLDFEGTLSAEPIARSDTASVVAGPTEPAVDGYIRLELVAAFAEGTITGGVYATYCASLSE